MTLALMAVRQEVNNFESSVVVQELEFAKPSFSLNLDYYILISLEAVPDLCILFPFLNSYDIKFELLNSIYFCQIKVRRNHYYFL